MFYFFNKTIVYSFDIELKFDLKIIGILKNNK
jgi:hypothetical protein